MRKPIGVAPHRLVQGLEIDAVECREISVQQHFVSAQEHDRLLDVLQRHAHGLTLTVRVMRELRVATAA